MKKIATLALATAMTLAANAQNAPVKWEANENPIVRHKHTADPAPFVYGDTLYLYAGIDYAGNQPTYRMEEWGLFATTDMRHWEEIPTNLKVDDIFKWQDSHAAWASHMVERNGKFYFYISTNWCGIGVAVADSPRGPFKDALGKPIVTTAQCPGTDHSWAAIDPAVFVDKDGQAWLYWGNRRCFAAKLKDNMIELDGEVMDITPEGSNYTEAAWVHERKGTYYLTFACGWPEKLGYATGKSPVGPFTYQGVFSEISGNSNTTHPGVVTFKGHDILFTHNGMLPEGSGYSRSVVAQELKYDKKGRILKCDIVTDGLPYIK